MGVGMHTRDPPCAPPLFDTRRQKDYPSLFQEFVWLVLSVGLFSFVVPALRGLRESARNPHILCLLCWFSFGFANTLFLEKGFLTRSSLLEVFAKGSWKHEIHWNGNKFQDGRNALFFAPFPFSFPSFSVHSHAMSPQSGEFHMWKQQLQSSPLHSTQIAYNCHAWSKYSLSCFYPNVQGACQKLCRGTYYNRCANNVNI